MAKSKPSTRTPSTQSQKEKLNSKITTKKSDGSQKTSTIWTTIVGLVIILVAICGGLVFQNVFDGRIPTFEELKNLNLREALFLEFKSCYETPSVDIYRHGRIESFSTNSCTTIDELITAAQQRFEETQIRRLVNRVGENLSNGKQALLQYITQKRDMPYQTTTDFFIALDGPQRELFVWPTVDNKTKIWVPEKKGKLREIEVKVLSKSPRIFEVPHFLTDEEAEHFVNKAKKGNLQRSTVSADYATKKESDIRTSSQIWVGPSQSNDDEVFKTVRERALLFTRSSPSVAEDVQVVHYSPNQHYYGHHDYSDPAAAKHNPYFQNGGNRFLTLLYYLNDVEAGGETAFPLVGGDGPGDPSQLYHKGSIACEMGGMKIRPAKGTAILFYNLLENGHMDGKFDPLTFHAGCDVAKGEKWCANQWIRNKRVNGKLYDAQN